MNHIHLAVRGPETIQDALFELDNNLPFYTADEFPTFRVSEMLHAAEARHRKGDFTEDPRLIELARRLLHEMRATVTHDDNLDLEIAWTAADGFSNQVMRQILAAAYPELQFDATIVLDNGRCLLARYRDGLELPRRLSTVEDFDVDGSIEALVFAEGRSSLEAFLVRCADLTAERGEETSTGVFTVLFTESTTVETVRDLIENCPEVSITLRNARVRKAGRSR